MKWIAVLAFASAFSGAASLPPSNLWLFEINHDQGYPEIVTAAKITDTDSYTSQPHFLKSSDRLYYTQSFPTEETEQTDAMVYSLPTGFHQNLTDSSASEYSPTPRLQSDGFSAIRVDDNNKQWLWHYTVDGKGQGKIIDVEPIGYHVWTSEDTLLAFVLGKPHTLQLLSTSGYQRIIEQYVGPSLWPVPDTDMFSYTKNPAPDSQPWTLMAYDPQSEDSTVLVTMPSQAYYMAWTKDGKAITAVGSLLMAWDFTLPFSSEASSSVAPGAVETASKASGSGRRETKWYEWLDLTHHCPKGVSRVHISSDNRYLAAVCNE